MANPETTLDGKPSARRQRLVRFLVEVLVSIVLSVLPFLIVQQLVAQRNILVAAVLLLFAWHGEVWLLYGIPPGIVLIAGLLLRRSGVIAGPALLIGGFFLAIVGVQTHQQIMLREFAPEKIEAAAGAHSMVALEGPAVAEDQKVEEGPPCGVLCRRVIATSPYAFAKRTSSQLWTVHRRAWDCQSDDLARSTLSFLFDGYIGVCAVETTQTEMTDALLYRAGVLTDEMRARLRAIPNSSTLEIVERTNGENRVLGRQFIGGLFHWAPLPLAYPSDRLADNAWSGPALGRRAFVAWALNVPLAELANKHRAPLKEVLDAVEYFVARPAVSVPAVETWGYIADSRAREDPRMIRPRIEAFLASDDPKRIAAALHALHGLDGGDRDAMRDLLIPLAFAPLLGEKDSPLPEMLRSIFGGCGFAGNSNPFPQEVRARAITMFVSTPTLSDSQRLLFFRMILCGGLDTRHEAIDALMSLQGAVFTATVAAVGHSAHAAFIWNGPDHWSPEEVDRLIDRAPEVPNSDLAAYVGAFSYHEWMSDPQRARLREQLQARLDLVKAAPVRDEEAIKVLSSLINQMRPLGR